ncbi:KH domain-containing protein At4g18375-like isoform X2 [Phragmites australis]|uniref:KH domain-containing protein At4g18375-like isoform X2 n=1 Tax=Phragmites australis TaxID=29695 RepID=UPI002D798217|nr:KH domain-containing protein At4g18375-like isoform X2 [Phragmites australis]
MDYGNSRSNSKKRTHFNSDDGKRKRLNSRHDDTSVSSEPIETIYRILCSVKKIGSVLGRGGDIVKALREETKAKIRVADSIPGADERVIIIFNYQNQSERADEAAENISNDGLENMKPHCSAQDALLKIHDKIVVDEVVHDGAHEKSEIVDDVTARILVPGNQVGCLLGKGGSIIQQLRSDTGAGIRVLPSENLPQCAIESDELVQISGAPSLVRKALYEISTRLHQHPRKENPPLEEIIDASTQRKRESPPPLQHGNPMLPHLRVDDPPPVPLLDSYRHGPLRYPVAEAEEFSVRILCASELIGLVIGKNGANVRQVEQQTGARIKVQEVDKDASGERLIIISSKEIPADPISPTIEALILLHNKVSAPSEKHHLSTRLVVQSSKVGCILGEGGKVITEMRRRTGAEIRVYSKADKPKYLSFDDELVQVAGPPAIARGALTEIASRLRTRTLRDASSANNPPPVAPFDGPPVDILPSREFTLYGRPANYPPYGRPAPAIDPPYGRPTNDPLYGRPAIDPPYGRPANDPPYGRPANDPPHGRPYSNIPYGRLNESAHRDPSHAYPVDFFSKREYPSGSPLFVSNVPSSAYQRYAAPARLPSRELPSSFSPGADYISHRSYRDHVPTDSYSSRGTQQLGVTRDGNSNAYEYTEAAGQMHGREDYRGLAATGFSSTIELRIPNNSMESIIGVGGVNLAEIRQISGARLRLLEAHAGSSESVVEIRGTLDQAKAAQSLLQGFISANSRGTQQPSQSQSSRMPHYPSWV